MTTDQVCPKCKMPKYSKGTGSMTSWIASCRCDLVTPSGIDDQVKTINLCSTCGKRINQGRVGSFTQFIFRFDLCACSNPSWAPNPENLDLIDNLPELQPDNDDADVDESLDFSPESFPVERYKPLKVIGAGAGGTVYLCRDLLLNKLVALKTLHALVGEQLVAFQNEARLLSKLDHPNIVRILDFGATKGGAPYMVLEHSSGSNLRDTISINGALPPESVNQIFSSLADALSYCHERGVFHRDLKPENILFTKVPDQPTTIKLIDFGIATAGVQEKTHFDGRELVGTPTYMPPDQIRGLNYDARSEIYSLGCVVFEAITGRPVFTGETALEILSKHANEPPPRLTDFTELSIPYSMQKNLSICLEKDPEDRFQSMSELKKALTISNDSNDQRLDFSKNHGDAEEKPVRNQAMSFKTGITITLSLLICGIVALTVFTGTLKTGTQLPTVRPSDAGISAKPVVERTYVILGKDDFISISGESIPKQAFKELAAKCKRKCSIVFDNQPPEVDWSGLSELANAPVTSLYVQGTTFGDNECKIVSRLPELRKIDLSFTNVTDNGIKSLSDSKTLSDFVISSSKVTGGCLKYLGAVHDLRMLELDGLPRVNLSDLQALLRCQKLNNLNVGHVPIGDEGLRLLCKIDSIRDLTIDTCSISDSGTKALVGTKIGRLSLADNPGITDRTIPYLIKMPMLRQFRYGQRNQITHDGEMRLKSAKPNLDIRSHQGLVVRPRVIDGFNELKELQLFEPDY